MNCKCCMSNLQHDLTVVFQGSILGPLLFLILLNVITDVVINTTIIKYADTTVINVADKDIGVSYPKLSNDLNAIGSWLD